MHCNKLKAEYWGTLKEKYKDTVHFTEYDITTPQGNLVFNLTADAYEVPKDQRGYPAAAVGSTYLMGYPTEIGTYAEVAIEKAYMRNARMDESQAGIKIARRNINNLRYADDTTLMAESVLPFWLCS